jgi:hypothetical protein
MARVVLAPNASGGKANDLRLFGVGQPDRATDARVERPVLGEWHSDHSLSEVSFDEQAFLAASM